MKNIGTKEEQKKIRELIKEADKRGFKKGTFYIRKNILLNGQIITQEEVAEHRAEYFCTYPDERGITLFCGPSQGLIYCRGEWTVEIDSKRSKKYW